MQEEIIAEIFYNLGFVDWLTFRMLSKRCFNIFRAKMNFDLENKYFYNFRWGQIEKKNQVYIYSLFFQNKIISFDKFIKKNYPDFCGEIKNKFFTYLLYKNKSKKIQLDIYVIKQVGFYYVHHYLFYRTTKPKFEDVVENDLAKYPAIHINLYPKFFTYYNVGYLNISIK